MPTTPAPRPAAEAGPGPTGPGIPRLPDGVAPPPSFAQERIWFFEQLTPGTSANGVYLAVRLRGPLRLELLGRAVQLVGTRHDSLRMCFPTVDGRPTVLVRDAIEIPWRVVTAADEDQARALLIRVSQYRFDIATGPLVRVSAIRLADDDHVLHVLAHHIITDGWSHARLLNEIATIYTALVTATFRPLAPAVRYGDFAAWQRERLTGSVGDKDLAYWRGVLTGVPPLELPTDRPRPTQPSHAGSGIVMELDAELTAGLRQLARAHRMSLFMVLFSGLAAVLAWASRQEDFAIGTAVAGRLLPEVEDVLGLFVNTLAIRVDVSGSPSFATLLRRTRERVLGALAHQEVPFERVVQELAVPRDLTRMPVYQVIFALQNYENTTGAWPPDVRAEWFGVPSDTCLFDLSLTLTDHGHGMTGWFAYSTDLFDRDTTARLADRLIALLAAAVVRPEAPLVELDGDAGPGRRRAEPSLSPPTPVS
jgi:hypothetical protein